MGFQYVSIFFNWNCHAHIDIETANVLLHFLKFLLSRISTNVRGSTSFQMMVFTMAIIPRKACSCLVDLAVSVQLNTGFIWICVASLYICWVLPFQCQSTCFFLKGKDNTNHTNHLDDNLQFPKSLGIPSFLKWLWINIYWIRYHVWGSTYHAASSFSCWPGRIWRESDQFSYHISGMSPNKSPYIYILLPKSSFFEGIMMLRYHAVGSVDHQQGGPGSGCRGRFGCHGSGRKEEPRQLFVAPGARQFVGSWATEMIRYYNYPLVISRSHGKNHL